jgi:hypothetical protein
MNACETIGYCRAIWQQGSSLKCSLPSAWWLVNQEHLATVPPHKRHRILSDSLHILCWKFCFLVLCGYSSEHWLLETSEKRGLHFPEEPHLPVSSGSVSLKSHRAKEERGSSFWKRVPLRCVTKPGMMVPACNWKPEVGGLQVQEFELSPGYIARPSLKKKKKCWKELSYWTWIRRQRAKSTSSVSIFSPWHRWPRSPWKGLPCWLSRSLIAKFALGLVNWG